MATVFRETRRCPNCGEKFRTNFDYGLHCYTMCKTPRPQWSANNLTEFEARVYAEVPEPPGLSRPESICRCLYPDFNECRRPIQGARYRAVWRALGELARGRLIVGPTESRGYSRPWKVKK